MPDTSISQLDPITIATAGPARWLAGLTVADLPDAIVRQARACLLDLAGVAAAGHRTRLGAIVRDVAAAQFGGKGARMILDGRVVSPSGAAYAGAALLDSFDAHDGHALTKGHAGAAVLPALLALADGPAPMDGGEFLLCLVLGYEVSVRAGIALHASAAEYHTSGAWNALGCAAVAARVLRLSPAQTREALGIAEYHGPRSPMMRCIAHPTMVKDGTGWGALAGVSAAFLAQAGFTGAPAELTEAAAHGALWSDLGQRWRITELYFKPHPVCRWAQPAMEAAYALAAAHDVRPEHIAAIRVDTFAEAAALTVAEPGTTEEAQYSLPFPLAALLVRGVVDADAIAGSGLSDRAVLALARRVSLHPDPALSARFPAERLARVSFTLADGTVLRSALTAPRGNPDAPLTEAELRAKFHALAAGLPAGRRNAIEAEVAATRPGRPVTALLDLLLEPA